MNGTVDTKYYQVIENGSVSERLLIRARNAIFDEFMRRMSPREGDRIVDVGVSDIINDGANFLERLYPRQQDITACGLGDAADFRARFPACTYRRIEPNARLPFEDKSFRVATSNAVLEHVGSFDDQVFHIRELCRVADRAFISVPHRYFPVEHHTSLPLLHYTDLSFRLSCSMFGKSEWCSEANLILMTKGRLRRLAAGLGRTVTIGYTGLPLGPFSSNLFLSIV